MNNVETKGSVQIHRFGVGGAEDLIEAIEKAGFDVGYDDLGDVEARHIAVFRDPLEAHLRILLSRWEELGNGRGLGRVESEELERLVMERVAPHSISSKVEQFVDHFAIDFKPPTVVPLRQQGAQIVEGGIDPVLLLRAGAPVDAIAEQLRSFLNEPTLHLDSIDAELEGAPKRHVNTVRRNQVKASYVTLSITQRWVQTAFTIGEVERIRKRWERVDPPAYQQTWTDTSFGREVTTPAGDESRKVFAAEGGFRHFSTGRTNIAVSNFWHSEVSDTDDVWNGQEIATLTQANRSLLEAGGDWEEVVDIGDFSPRRDVLIHEVRVSVRDMPIGKYPFFLGDNCIYVEESEYALEALGESPVLPHAGEIHCTAVSFWENGSYDRSLHLPDGCPLLLTRREKLRIPTCFSRHRPHSLDAEDFATARVRIEIEYTELNPQYRAHKFVRIPYLDQYPDADKLILPGRPWYQAWDRKIPLDVKGFSVYFSPKAAIEQHIQGIALYVIGEDGNEVPGKRLALPDQVVGGGHESTGLSPAFVEGHLRIEPGEYLSAEGVLADGTPSADCAVFVLIEIPDDRISTTMTNPLYRSNGVANLEYVNNLYNADREISRPTPAGIGAVESVALCQLEPWVERFGLTEMPEDEEERRRIMAEAAGAIFID